MQNNKLSDIIADAKKSLENVDSLQAAEDLRVRMLGKKGEFTQLLKGMGSLSPEERKDLGKSANMAKNEFAAMLNEKKEEIEKKAKAKKLEAERIDVTEPGRLVRYGVQHPITQTINEIVDIFRSMGYSVFETPEVDTTFYSFDGLNAPEDHPARDKTDTFYISDDVVLRPHTSTCEVRAEEQLELPYKIVSPGRCFRCDTPDATHSPTFHQIEMMVVGEGITMADLKGSLDLMAKRMFGPETRTKFRPHHFPFTEPSAEMDVSCFKCGGKGCNVCKGSGWIEILGCGMTHPHVHKFGDIDTEKYTGFAVGMGVERIAMLKYGIDDIRLLYEDDVRFIDQFK
ncbi:MAG: phenylalanine--tRNA ligase subunit alpha [Anaerovoracaceae bacterium]|jgi:phenylalanyl-tRNA synthetase alpha chain